MATALPPVPASEESLLLEVLPLAMMSTEPPRARPKSVLRHIRPQWCPSPRIAAIYRDMKSFNEDGNFMMWLSTRLDGNSPEFKRWAEAMTSAVIQTADLKLIGEHLKAEFIKRQDQQLLSDYISADRESVKIATLDKLRKLYKENADDNTEDITPDMQLPPVCYCLQSPDGIDFAPKREICAIKGRAKHGKTHLLSIFLAAMLQPQMSAVCGITCNQQGLHILYIDTEQSKQSSRKILRGALRLAGLDPMQPCPFVDMKNMRKEAKTRRKEKIEELVSTGKYDVVIVDGIKDLCLDFNDLKEADQLMVDILDMIETYNVAYITVLHENPSGDNSKMRGHLGTEVENKSFEVFQSKKKDDVFNVLNTERREKTLAAFAFRFNDDDELEQCEPNDNGDSKSSPNTDLPEKGVQLTAAEKKWNKMTSVFKHLGVQAGYTPDQICDTAAKLGLSRFGRSTIYEALKDYTASGRMVENNGFYGLAPSEISMLKTLEEYEQERKLKAQYEAQQAAEQQEREKREHDAAMQSSDDLPF